MSRSFGVLGLRAVLCSLLMGVLSACGGGGGGGGSTAIKLSAPSMTFNTGTGTGPQTQRIEAAFLGSGVVVGYAPGVTAPSWLQVEPLGGAEGNKALFDIHADPYSLSPGTYKTSLRFVTGIVPDGGGLDDASDITYVDLPVTMTVVRFDVSPVTSYNSLVEGSAADYDGSFSLTVPAGTQWTATSNSDWLKVVTGSGTGSGNVEYTVAAGDMPAGYHHGVIAVKDGNDRETYFSAILSMAAPQLYTTPSYVYLQKVEGELAASTGTFSLDTPMTMTWTASSNQPWLTVTGSGTGPGSISYSMSSLNLAPGYHYGFITITDKGGRSTSVSFTLIVSEAPFSLSGPWEPLQLVSGDPTPKTGSVSLETLDGRGWTATSGQPWLTVTNASGTGSATIGYSVSAASLPVGFQYVQVSATDTRSGRTTSVNVPVSVSEPKLVLTPTVLDFDIGSDVSVAARTRRIKVSDELGSTAAAKSIAWNLSTSSWPYALPDWLSLSRTSGGSAPAEEISVVVPSEVLSTMTNGTYTYTLRFLYIEQTPYGGTGREIEVPVTLRIDAPVSKLEVSRQGDAVAAIAQGPQVRFRGKATYAHGYSEDLTTQLTWSSSDTAVASFEPDMPGVVQPLKGGTTQIKATLAGSTPQGNYELKVDAAKSLVYILEDYYPGPRINQYVTGQDGRLQPMRQPALSVSDSPQSLVFTPDGKYAYLSYYLPFEPAQYALSQFSVDASGMLSPLPTSRVLVGSYAPQALAMDKQGKQLYVLAHPNGRILRLDVGADGGLLLDAKPPVNGGGQGYGLALHPTLPYLYQSSYDANSISRFQIGDAGVLSFADSQLTGTRPRGVAVHPAGKALYVSNETDYYGGSNALSQYRMEADGQLTPVAAPLELASSWGGPMVMAPNGKYLFMSHNLRTSSGYPGDTEVAVLELDENGLGSFKFSYLVSSLLQLALDPTGSYLYASTGHGTVLQYKVGVDGTLVMDDHIVKLGNPRAIVVRPAPATAP